MAVVLAVYILNVPENNPTIKMLETDWHSGNLYYYCSALPSLSVSCLAPLPQNTTVSTITRTNSYATLKINLMQPIDMFSMLFNGVAYEPRSFQRYPPFVGVILKNVNDHPENCL